MMVKWANDGSLQANDGKMLVNDGEMLVNDGEMSTFDHHWEAAPTDLQLLKIKPIV